MVISAMHTQFKINVDKVDSFNSQLFEPEEIDVLLNTAQDKLIKELSKEGLENTQTRQDMLAPITVHSDIVGANIYQSSGNQENGYYIELPLNYRRAIKENVIVLTVDCQGLNAEVIRKVVPTTYDKFDTVVENPFTKPDSKYCLRLVADVGPNGNKRFQVITNGDGPTTYRLDYLRDPVQMQYGSTYPVPIADVDCELSTEAQQWILEEASKQALLNIQSQTYPAKKVEIGNTD